MNASRTAAAHGELTSTTIYGETTMKKLLTTIVLVAGLVLGTLAFAPAAQADGPGVAPWPGGPSEECYSQAYVDGLDLRIAALEYDQARLADEHAAELRRLEQQAWTVQREHDAEVNELSAALGDADATLREERAKVFAADTQNLRLRATIQRLRAKIRALR